jgi:hypothetical protein
MEIAIPAFAIGALYLINNQSKSNKDGFNNRSQLPNVDVPNRNYPSEYPIVSTETDQTSQLSTTNPYEGGAYTDKYFNPNSNNSIDSANADKNPNYYSLTGDKVDGSYFQHNNMVPFFGSNLRTRLVDENAAEGILDNYSGAGSQYITKTERSPLFAPSDNQQWAYGAPNQSDFFQSRVNPSSRMANVKPFEDELVAPGLGLGYTTAGSGGFNSGMLARESWLPKTADELRVDNNPKASGYKLFGHEGPANSYIKYTSTTDHMGVMEKHLPDQSFELAGGPNNPFNADRLFTTTGLEKGQTLRAIPVERHVTRPETAVSYSGIAGNHNTSIYVPGEYMPSHNQQLGEMPMAIANANGRHIPTDADYEIRAKRAYPNNRTVNHQDSYFGAVGGGIGAVVAPILDALRPSRRQNVIGTLRPYQNPSTSVSESYIFNPADRPAPTIRETTEKSKNHLNVNANQLGGAYKVTDHQSIQNNRQTTGDYYYAGGASAGARTQQTKSYESGYNQRNNDLKSSTIDGRLVPGNMSLLNGDINARQSSRDGMLKNNRAIVGTMPYQTMDAGNMGQLAGNSNKLYANLQMDRNTSDITDMLKGNPYVVNYKNGL